MRQMKDSNIPWIGEIPINWKTMSNKYLMKKVKDINAIYNGEDILSLSMKGVHVRDLEAGGKMPSTFDGYQNVYEGNLLMCLFDIDVTPRCIGLIKQDGITSPAYSQFHMEKIANSSYYYYYYLLLDYDKTLLHLSKNLRHSLTEEQLGSIKTLVPPIVEQKRIADFLDRKCTEIDELISDLQEQIDTLDQYRRSVITEAVTHGLKSGLKTKNSGIVWMGYIPSHWRVIKTKYLFEIVKRIAGEEGYDVLSVTQQGLKVKDLDDYGGQIAESYAGYQFVYPEDFVMNHMDLLTGWVDYSDKFGVTSPDYRVFRLIDKKANSLDYFKYVFQCCYLDKIYYSLGNGVAGVGRWRLQAYTFKNFRLPVPPLEEQVAIAKYLDEKCSSIAHYINANKQKIAILQDYKKSIIYEYVTGKKEVPA